MNRLFFSFLTCFLLLDLAFVIITAVVVWFRIAKLRSFILEVIFALSIVAKISLCFIYLNDYQLPEKLTHYMEHPKWIHLVWPIMILIHAVTVCSREFIIHTLSISKNSIQVAVNELDSGLMYFTGKGHIVLMNKRMEKLSRIMLGAIPGNGNDFWLSLIAYTQNSRCKRIDLTDGPTFSFDNGEVWGFTKNIVSDSDATYVEIIAKNVTDLYNRRAEIEAENRKLEKLERELGVVLRNISETSNAEELLNYKIRIHDQLGNAILRTRKTIRDGYFADENVDEILTVWENTIKAFENNIAVTRPEDREDFEKVVKQAHDLGIILNVYGEIPKDDPLIARCIREAMYNSIRHAYANTINVEGKRTAEGLYVMISDDAVFTGTAIKEGGGLSSIRREIEKNGGRMKVYVDRGVVLKLFFREDEHGQY